MDFDTYQRQAMRTQNTALTRMESVRHAVFGLSSEAGEIAGIFQKELQGHDVRIEELLKEVGDCLWMLAELCSMFGMKLGTAAEMNIEKLKKRYPSGFDAEKSLHRAVDDI